MTKSTFIHIPEFKIITPPSKEIQLIASMQPTPPLTYVNPPSEDILRLFFHEDFFKNS